MRENCEGDGFYFIANWTDKIVKKRSPLTVKNGLRMDILLKEIGQVFNIFFIC
jgi:hypothetical protein